jgi:hypothetical protein
VCVPDSASRPCSITNSRDARRSVDNRCAIANTVRPVINRIERLLNLALGLRVSTLLVALVEDEDS